MESSYNDRRRQTRSSVYHCLYETEGFCTRQMLAQNLGLSLPTIYQNLTELVDSGFVRYSGEAHSTGGRRAAGLEIIPDARIAVGAVVGAVVYFLLLWSTKAFGERGIRAAFSRGKGENND